MTIYCFLKIFEKEDYAREFVAGKLFLNTLGYFRGIDNAEDGRGDPYEALIGWHQAAQIGTIEIAGRSIRGEELAGPLVIQEDGPDAHNILCLYSVASPFEKVSAETIRAFQEQLRVSDRCAGMGSFTVLIQRPKEFIERFAAAVRRSGFGLTAGPIEYFDPDSFSGNFKHPGFAKRKQYEWQREYRFRLDRGVGVAEAYRFDIGPLDDLCTIFDSSRLSAPDAIAVELPR